MHDSSVKNSHSLLSRITERIHGQPDSIALVTEGDQVTYAELGAMAEAAYAGIARLGLPPGGRVAIHAEKSPRTIALIVACLMGRQPFLLPSKELGASSLAALVERAGCRDFLTAESPDPGRGRIHHIDCTPGTGAIPPAALREPPAPGAEDTGFMLTTSGSTGLPKIVPLTTGAVDRFTAWASSQFSITRGTVVLNYAPLSFDLCLLDIWATLSAGGTAVLVGQDGATDGRHLAELVRTRHVDVIQSVPMLYRLLADAPDRRPFTGVRHVIITGDKIQRQLLGDLPRLFPGARIYNLYGCTETNDSFIHEITDAGLESGLPIGRPIAGVDAIVADEDGTPLEGPAEGELLVRTPFQTTGYLDPALNEEKFVDAGDGRGPFFRSGDLVRRDGDDVYTLLGRNDFQVKVRGTRVNLAEIEHVFLGHEQVLDAAVITEPDEVAGVRLHAVVRRRTPGSLNSLILREHCRLQLPRTAIPTKISLVDDPLPTTSTGKVDRQEISRVILTRS
jgi:acyl-coenzyme A synthetase/AMP-(fatty) acid ligase